MSGEERAILNGVLLDPHSDAPRLVYAEWLDETGDQRKMRHAEFIRLQCEAAVIRAEGRAIDFSLSSRIERLFRAGVSQRGHDFMPPSMLTGMNRIWRKVMLIHMGAMRHALTAKLRHSYFYLLFNRGFVEVFRTSQIAVWCYGCNHFQWTGKPQCYHHTLKCTTIAKALFTSFPIVGASIKTYSFDMQEQFETNYLAAGRACFVEPMRLVEAAA